MKKTLQLLTLCTAFSLWAPPIDMVESAQTLEAFAAAVTAKGVWNVNDSQKMMSLMKPANEEFPTVKVERDNYYLQTEGGVFAFCDVRETAKKITTIFSTLLGGIVVLGSSAIWQYYQNLLVGSKVAILGGIETDNLPKMKESCPGIWNWFISLIQKPAEWLFPDRKYIADNRTSFNSVDSLDSISFFKSHPRCKEIYRKFANISIANGLKYFKEIFHENSHKALIFSAKLAEDSLRSINNIITENSKLKGIEDEKNKLEAANTNITDERDSLKIAKTKAEEQKSKIAIENMRLKNENFVIPKSWLYLALGCFFVQFIVRSSYIK
jgi:hypothetical protein